MDSTNNPAGARVLVGRYRLGERLGRGGMGDVYRATDQVLARQVAVKLFRPDVSDEALDQRHESEARVLAGLNHPGLVSVYDIGTDDEQPFLVMELVEGETLADLVRRGPLAPAQVASLGGQLAASLQAIHDAGVIHRDIKPANVLVCGSDDGAALRTKLTDFGIARLVDGTRLTSTGLLIGTVQYLSPEQTVGGTVSLPVRRLRPRARAAGVPDRACRVPRGGDRDRRRAPQPPARDPRRARPPVGGRAGRDDRARAGAATDRRRGGVPALGPVRTGIRRAGGRLRPAPWRRPLPVAPAAARGRGCGCGRRGCGAPGARRPTHRGGPVARAGRHVAPTTPYGVERVGRRSGSAGHCGHGRGQPGPAPLPRASRPPGRPAPHRPGPPPAAHGQTADPASVSSPGRGAAGTGTSSRHGGTTSAPDPGPSSSDRQSHGAAVEHDVGPRPGLCLGS